MKKSLFLLTILTVNILSVIIIIEDLYEQELPDVVIPRLDGSNFTYVSRSSGSSRSSNPDLTSEDQTIGSGSEIQDMGIKYHILDNATHNFVEDPTNQTDGYYVPIGVEYLELNGSRGQSAQHFYNATSETYSFNSAQLVNKSGVVDGTDWILYEEYPNRFIIRLINGSIYRRETPAEMNTLIAVIGDNSTIWAVGYESYMGVMAFYMNFADTDWGHGQYLWYPRLKNGQLAAFNQPLYAMYLHLYVNYTGTIYDQIINDRILYNSSNNPRNNLHFYNESDAFGLYFFSDDIEILSSNWDFKNGFKFNLTDNLFHTINEIKCSDRDFLDVGWAYEITSSPQSDGTPYQPDRFIISNGTHEVFLNISEAWNAGAYLNDYYSYVEILSQNNESFWFAFDDMEEAGFTEKYLNLHNQTFPDGSWRYVLRAGMYGYGSYTQDTWINIDPPTGTLTPTDNYDLYYLSSWTTSAQINRIGYTGGTSQVYVGYIAFDTVINVNILSSITSPVFSIYTTAGTQSYESGEGCSVRVYNINAHTDGQGSGQAREDSTSYTQGTSNLQTGVWQGAKSTNTRYNGDTTKVDTLIEYWAANRGTSENYISFRMQDYNGDDFTDDQYNWWDSQYGSNYPQLSFTYTVGSANNAPVTSFTSDGNYIYAGIEESAVVFRYTDADGYNDLETMHLFLSNDNFATIDITINYNVDTNVVTTTDTSGFLIALPNDPTESAGGSATGGSGYYDLTWKFIIDWDTNWDDTDIDFRSYCYDDEPVQSNTVTDTTTGETFDEELIFKTSTWTLSDAAYSEDGNTNLLDNEWFRGGVSVTATGVVSYELSTSVYPPTGIVDVELKENGVLLGETYDDDTLGASGEYSITAHITDSTSGIDADYDFEVVFTDWTGTADSGNTGTHAGNYLCESSRDNEIPSQISYTMSSGTYYADITNDGTPTLTIAGATDGSGSGLHATPYEHLYRVDGGGWASYTWRATAAYDHPVSTSSQDVDFAARVRDLVGNVGSYSYDNDNTVDLVNPSIDTLSGSESSLFLYDLGNGIAGYYGSLMSSPEDYSLIGTASDNYGLEIISGSLEFGDTPSDSSPASYILTYTVEASDNGIYGCTITLYDQAGNSDTDSFNFIEDNDGISLTLTVEVETSDYLYAAYGSSAQGVYGSNMGSLQSFTVEGNAYGQSVPARSIVDDTSFGNNPSVVGTYSEDMDWSFEYQIDAADNGDVVITYTATSELSYTDTVVYYFYEENTDPSGFTHTLSRAIGWNDAFPCYYNSTSQVLWFNNNQEFTGSGDHYFSITVNNDGSFGLVGFSEITWDMNSLFETLEHDVDPLPESKDFNYYGDSGGTFAFRIVDLVGNYQEISYTASLDITAPTGYVFNVLDDPDATIHYQPNSGYYDDTSAWWNSTPRAEIIETQSGMLDTHKGFWMNSTPYGEGNIDEGDQLSLPFGDGLYNFEMATIDAVGNVGIAVSSPMSPILDTSYVSGVSFTITRETGIDDGYHSYIFWATTTIWFNPLFDDYFTITANSGNFDNSGYWKTVWDTGSRFETVEHDEEALPHSKNFNYYNDYLGSSAAGFKVFLVNNAGNRQLSGGEYGYDDDFAAPTGGVGVVNSDATADIGYLPNTNYYDDDSVNLEITGSVVDSESDLPTIYFGYAIESVYLWSSSSTYSYPSVADGNNTATYQVRDNVGNIATLSETLWVIVDHNSPSGTTLTETQLTGYPDGYRAYSTGGNLYFDPDSSMGFFLTVNDDGTFYDSGFWKVEFDKNSVFLSGFNDTDTLPNLQGFDFQGDTSGTFIIRVINNAGNYQTFTYTAIEDDVDPVFDSYTLDVHPDSLHDNYWKTLFPNTTLVNPTDATSGLIPLFLHYAINGSFGVIDFTDDLTFTWNASHGIQDQYNHSLSLRIHDYVGNYYESLSPYVICDTIAPVLGVLSLDEMYAPNFYDQSIAHTANATVTWTDNHPFIVDYSGVLAGSDDVSPSGGSSVIPITITGEANGWYQVNIVIWDAAGWSHSVLVYPTYGYGIIQLDNTLGTDEVEIWFYFYFFKSSGLGLDWKDYNTSYVIDEAWYPNNTLSRIRGGVFAQKFLNFTSSIRFEVYDYFGNLLHNTTYPLPTSRDIYIELAVNTFKTVNLYSNIVNMSITRGSATFTEQLMPNEIFAWNLFAAEYNLTVYLHKTGAFAYDDEGYQLNNYSVDLTASDMAVFIRDVYEELCSILISDQSGNFLDPRGFKIFIETVRIYGDTFLWNDTLITKNITLTDLFGNSVYQDLTTAYSRFIEVTLSIWSVKVFNLDQDPIHLFITQNNLNVTEWIMQYTLEEFYLKNGTYTMHFYYTELDDNYIVHNGTFVTKVAQVFSDLVIFVDSDDIIAIAVSVDVPQPADPNIDVTVTQNNTEVIYLVEDIQEEVNFVRGEITFIGSFLAMALLGVLVIILLALFLPQRYDQIREKVQDGRIRIYEKGENVKDEYFPEVDF